MKGTSPIPVSSALVPVPSTPASDPQTARKSEAEAGTGTVEEAVLPWWEHTHGGQPPVATICLRRKTRGGIEETVIVDGPIDPSVATEPPGGAFTRTIRRQRSRNIAPPHIASDVEPESLFSDQPLGVIVRHGWLSRVEVRLFAPRASAVVLVIQGARGETRRRRMRPDADGAWRTAFWARWRNLVGRPYLFEVSFESPSPSGPAVSVIADPYAHLVLEPPEDAQAPGPPISAFADLDHDWGDQNFCRPAGNALVIYETHVKDLSALTESLTTHERGTYRGLASDPVIGHLKRLGVALELLPIQAFDPFFGGHWGYSTTFYNAPTTRYATEPVRANRELKAAVDALHQAGIPVIMDVVYNHTSNDDRLHFKVLDRGYYYRLTDDQQHDHNGSGTGNELASERPMVRRLIIDTLLNFVTNYHIDGFRFDLAALIDVRTMLEIDRALPEGVFLFAEPWAYDHTRARWGKEAMRGVLKSTRWAIWNDDFRNAALAFITGRANDNIRNALMNGLCGSVYDGSRGFTDRPGQSVNSITSHDEYAFAHLVGKDPKRQFLGALVVLFAQGIPMLTQGHEFMHDKSGWRDTWNQDNEINWLNWALRDEHEESGLIEAHVRAIALRRALPHFKYDRLLTHEDVVWVYPEGYPQNDNHNAIGFMLRPPPVPAATSITASSSSAFSAPSASSVPPASSVWSRAWQRLLDLWRQKPNATTAQSTAEPHIDSTTTSEPHPLAETNLLILLNGHPSRSAAFRLPEGESWTLIVDGESLSVDEHGLSHNGQTRSAQPPNLWHVQVGTGVVLAQKPTKASADEGQHATPHEHANPTEHASPAPAENTDAAEPEPVTEA